ncbi:MAG TPA: N-acetylmuramoyl-L-alanine amidase [Polyangia bacterium]|jgi:N-acetyl-anhydromuramyl-L-alanine amidase AmpD|nr:N-acetylmuramoyl-L-alanine amidase [Polyangia bacterium]
MGSSQRSVARRRRPRSLAAALAAAAFAASGAELGAAPAGGGGPSTGTSIVIAGRSFDVGRPVVLWSDPQGFDAYQTRCIDQTGGCCDGSSPRFGARKGVVDRSLPELQDAVSQLVLHFDGCVNSRSCFKSMHNRPRPAGSTGCGLSAHFMIDADGTIYQTLDLVERAFHAEEANSGSVGVEICNRGRVDKAEWPKLPPDYRARPEKDVVINGEHHLAYEFRAEQYDSIIALARTLLRVFPRIRPVMPEKDGAPIMDTLPDPLSFAGILGHLHVDLQKQKWDPGALDWGRIMRALNGFELPVQVRSFTEVPKAQADWLAARRALFFAAEERATGFFPIASGRLWHSGVHLRAALGSPVRAPTRGRVVAVRRGAGQADASSHAFVLIRHELTVGDEPVTFYSLLAHLALPDLGTPAAAAIPWMQALARAPRETQAAFEAGAVVTLDERAEAGDLVGQVGLVSRGAEQGPEVHFEIFTTERLGGALGRVFHYVNAGADGPLVRRADIIAAVDANGDQEVDAAELARFFHAGDYDKRQALRNLAVRHRHEWGDHTTEDEVVGLRELAGVPEADRRRIYKIAIAPYVFWSDDLSRAIGLPMNQTIVSYNPLTFLMEIAARSNGFEPPRARGREIGDASLEARKLAHVPVADWTSPRRAPLEPPLFGPPVGLHLAAKRKEDIPLIELAPTDSR